MNIRTSLFILCLLMSSYSYSNHYRIDYDLLEDIGLGGSKIYVEPSQIHILPEGIFYEDQDGELKSTDHVFCDQWGMFMLPDNDCPRPDFYTLKVPKLRDAPYY